MSLWLTSPWLSPRSLVPALALAGWTSLGCGPAVCGTQSGQICTVAGTGQAGLGGEAELGTRTALFLPTDVTAGIDGQLYIVDFNNHRVRTLGADGKVRTVVGTGEIGDGSDGRAIDVSFNHPSHVSFDPQGRLVLSAWQNSVVKRMDLASGLISTVCGNGAKAFGGDEGPAGQAVLNLPVNTAFGPDGSMYIADQGNQRIRKIDNAGVIHTVVGGQPGFRGDEGPATQAKLLQPFGQGAAPSGKIAVDAAGNLFIADSGNQRIRKVTLDGIIHTIAGTGEAGAGGAGGPATAATLGRPTDLALAPDGTVFFADTDNSCVRKIDPAGIISTVAGTCGKSGYGGDSGPAHQALLLRPFGLDLDKDGRLYIADTYNHRVRVVFP